MFECECIQFRLPPGGARDMMFSFGIKSRLLLLSTKCFIYFPMGLLWRFTVNRNRLISRTPCPRDRDLPNTLCCHNTLFITWNRDENKPPPNLYPQRETFEIGNNIHRATLHSRRSKAEANTIDNCRGLCENAVQGPPTCLYA